MRAQGDTRGRADYLQQCRGQQEVSVAKNKRVAITATRLFAFEEAIAALSPEGPAPITTRSYMYLAITIPHTENESFKLPSL